jgi:peptidyl-tRNA hydrolase, PTH1 family
MDRERIAIIGLGNPGKKYQKTRHNIGFRIIDALLETKEFSPANQDMELKQDSSSNSLIGETHYKQIMTVIAKPQTFVNNSGKTVKTIKDRFKLKNKNIWIVCDDLDLTIGKIRVRAKGSSGGHNGLEDIINRLSGDDFGRIRIGIKPIKGFEERSPEFKDSFEAKEFVLGKFRKREENILKKVIDKTTDHIVESLNDKCLIKTTIQV